MGDHLALMAAHLRLLAHQASRLGPSLPVDRASMGAPPPEMAKAGATLLQARAHLDDRSWRRWVTEDVGIPVEQARQFMAAAELAGASVETLRPREL